MSQVNNSEVIQELRLAAKLQLGKDKIPNFLSSGIVPTIELNPKIIKNSFSKSVTQTASGALAILAANPTQDIYIVGLAFSVIKDAACDVSNSTVGISGTINGLATTLLGCAVLTATAQNSFISITLQHPIKIDRNTAINHTSSAFTAGNMVRSATVVYFIDETSQA